MKDAIGGTWIMGLVALFVVLFISFIAVAINYTKAFKVKNEVINIIERREGYNTSVKREIDNYLNAISYNTTANIRCETGEEKYHNVCIKKTETHRANSEGYYKVTSFVIIELPLAFTGSFTVPVSGETKLIYNLQE